MGDLAARVRVKMYAHIWSLRFSLSDSVTLRLSSIDDFPIREATAVRIEPFVELDELIRPVVRNTRRGPEELVSTIRVPSSRKLSKSSCRTEYATRDRSRVAAIMERTSTCPPTKIHVKNEDTIAFT
tara:strand:- start:203 stop:583 length:381 start_codon:yes stop_codon:yes gene_type:complete